MRRIGLLMMSVEAGSEAEFQQKLDAFRESVLPWSEYGIMLERAGRHDTQRVLDAPAGTSEMLPTLALPDGDDS